MGDIGRRVRAVIGVGGAVAAVGAPFVPTPVVSVPVGDVIAPAVALGVVRRILRVRAEQVRTRAFPSPLPDAELVTLARVVGTASTAASCHDLTDDSAVPPAVQSLLGAVSVTSTPPERAVPSSSWRIVVRLVGEPLAESRDGTAAVFGKKRSMELLAWMVLNRDRLSRSAARNSMWDVSVADSTFGTVLTDLRRGLSRLAPAPTDQGWCPATFTDRLVLAEGIVSDVDMLRAALGSARKEDLVRELSRVRDVPFAGTAYLWADLDGSTTRTVITVLDAVDALVRIGTEDGDQQAVLTAVRAGLRVMPGDEGLLRTLDSLVPGRGRHAPG